MNTALVKFLILWIMCKNIGLTTSMAQKVIANKDDNIRQKRSSANNFSLFGFNVRSQVSVPNPISTARESVKRVANIFSSNRGNTNNYYEPMEPYVIVRNTNTFSPIDFPNRSGIPNSMTQDQEEERYIWPQEVKTEFVKKTLPNNKKQSSTDKSNIKTDLPVLKGNDETPENTADNQKIDKRLLDFIFQKPQFNYDNTGKTVENNIDFVTETDEYETTTDMLNRFAPEVVATLLG